MTPGADQTERRWVAEDPDSVAGDHELGFRADHAAADARDLRQDVREEGLSVLAESLDSLTGPPTAGLDRHRTGTAPPADLLPAPEGPALAAADREVPSLSGMEASEPTLLALAFAHIADRLYDAETYEQVLGEIAEAAVAAIAPAEHASVTLPEQHGYRTAASTGQQATEVDQEQYAAGEGPSIDALTAPLVVAPSFPDPRWPGLSDSPVEHGVASALSFQLSSGPARPGQPAGSLNVYSAAPAAFTPSAIEIGSILAAHAALAARAVGERADLTQLNRQLQEALLSRDIIGQAKGILMERLKATPEQAFDILRRSSVRLNIKLREIALRLTETGELDTLNPEGT